MTSEKASPTGSGAVPTPTDMCDKTETTTAQAAKSPKKVATVRGRIAMFEVIANNDSPSCESPQSGQSRVQEELASFKLDSIRNYFRCGGSLPCEFASSPARDDEAKRRNSDQPSRKLSTRHDQNTVRSCDLEYRDRSKLTTFNNRSLIEESTKSFGGINIVASAEDNIEKNEVQMDGIPRDEDRFVPDSIQSILYQNCAPDNTEKDLESPVKEDFPNSFYEEEIDIEAPMTCVWIPEMQGVPSRADIPSTDNDGAEERSASANDENNDNDPEAEDQDIESESAQVDDYEQQEDLRLIRDSTTKPLGRSLIESLRSSGAPTDRDSAYLSLSCQPSSTDGAAYESYEPMSPDRDSALEKRLTSAPMSVKASRRSSSGDYEKANPLFADSVYDRIFGDLREPLVPPAGHKTNNRKHASYIPCTAARSYSWRPGSVSPTKSSHSRSRGASGFCKARRRAVSVDQLDILPGDEDVASAAPMPTPSQPARESFDDSIDSCSDIGFESSSEFGSNMRDSTRNSESGRSLGYDADDDECDPYDHPQFLMLEDPYDTPLPLDVDGRGRSDTATTITQPRDSCQRSDYLCEACFEDHEDACSSRISCQSPTNAKESEYDNPAHVKAEKKVDGILRNDYSDVFEEIREDEDTDGVDLMRSLSPLFYYGSPSSEPPKLPDRPPTESESDFSPKGSTNMSPYQSPRPSRGDDLFDNDAKVKFSLTDETQREVLHSRGSSSEESSSILKGNRQRKLSDNSWDRMMRMRTKTLGRQLSIPLTTDAGIQAFQQQENKKRSKLKSLISAKFAFKRSRSYQNVLSADELQGPMVVSDIPHESPLSLDDSSHSSTPPPKTKKRGKKKALIHLFTGEKGSKKEEKSEC